MSGSDRAVFLDRDGVINRRRLLLVREPRHLQLIPGALEAIRTLGEAGYRVIVVTNQSGVGYGLIREEDLAATHALLAESVEAHGGRLDAVYASTFRKGDPDTDAKPRPTMLQRGAEAFDLDPAKCWMVGDKASDVKAGQAFGARTVWITGSRFPWDRLRRRPSADFRAHDIGQAVETILREDAEAVGEGPTPPDAERTGEPEARVGED